MPKISPVSYQKLAKIFEAEGFRLFRQHGDHLIYVKAGIIRPVVIPMYRDVPVFVIKNNLRAAHISREKYFVLLSGC